MQPIRHRQLEPSVDSVVEADIEYRRSRIMSASIKSHNQQQHSMSRYHAWVGGAAAIITRTLIVSQGEGESRLSSPPLERPEPHPASMSIRPQVACNSYSKLRLILATRVEFDLRPVPLPGRRAREEVCANRNRPQAELRPQSGSSIFHGVTRKRIGGGRDRESKADALNKAEDEEGSVRKVRDSQGRATMPEVQI